MERLRQLEQSEKQLVSALQSLGLALQELSKEKTTIKLVENHSSNFLHSLENIESNLSRQITYLSQVSTGQAHEGSAYGSQKQLDMAMHRLEHSKSRVKELDRMRIHQIHESQLASRRSDYPTEASTSALPQQQQPPFEHYHLPNVKTELH